MLLPFFPFTDINTYVYTNIYIYIYTYIYIYIYIIYIPHQSQSCTWKRERESERCYNSIRGPIPGWKLQGFYMHNWHSASCMFHASFYAFCITHEHPLSTYTSFKFTSCLYKSNPLKVYLCPHYLNIGILLKADKRVCFTSDLTVSDSREVGIHHQSVSNILNENEC